MSSTHLYLLNKNALRILSISNYSSNNNNNNDQEEENINNKTKNKTSSFPLTRDPSCWWNFLSCSCPRGSDDEQQDENFVNSSSSSSSTVVVSHLERNQYCIILKSIELPSCLHEEKLEILESILNNNFNTNNFSSSAVTTTSMKTSTLTSFNNNNNNNTPSKVTDHEVVVPKSNNNILCLPSSNNKKMRFVFVRSVFSSTTGKKNEKNNGFVMGWIPEMVLSRQSFTLEHLTTKKANNTSSVPTTIVSNGSFPSFSSSPTSTAEIYFSSLLSSSSSSSSSLSKNNNHNFEYKKLMFGSTTTKTKQPQQKDESLLSSSHHHHSYANTLFKYKLVKHNGKNYQQRASPNSFYINNFNASSNFSLKSGGGASPSPPHSPASPPPVHNSSSSSSPYSPPSAGGASPNQNVANANNGTIVVPSSIRSSSPNNNNSSNETVLEVFPISVSEAKNPPPFLGAAPISQLSQQQQRHHHPSSSSSSALLQQLPLSCQTDLRHLIMFAENDATHTSTFSPRLGEGGSGFVLMGAVRRKTNKIIIVAPQQQEQGQEEDPNEITSTALDELHQRLEIDKNKDETSTTSSHHQLVAVKFIPLSLFGSSSSMTSVSASSSFNTKFEHLRREIITHALTSSHPTFVKLFGVYPVYSSVSASVLTPQMVLDNNSPEFLSSLPPFVVASKNQNNNNTKMNTASGKIIGVSLVFPFCDGGSLESLISSQASAFGGVFKNNHPSSSATPSYSSPNGKMAVGTKSSPLILRSGNNSNDNDTSSSSPTLLIRGSPPPLQKSSHLAQASSSSTIKKNTTHNTSSRQRSTSSSATNNNSPNRMLQYNTNSSSTMPSLSNSPSKKSGLQQNNATTNVYGSPSSPSAHDQQQQQYFSFPLAPLREFEIASILYAVVCGLNFLHNTLGIAHRDMKPGNILLNSKGEILIADLGIAKQVCSENHYIRRCDLVLKKHFLNDAEGEEHESKSPFNSSSGDINHSNRNEANDNPFDTLIGPPSATTTNENNSNSNITLENSIGFPSQQQHHNSSAPQVQRSITPPPNLGGGMTFCGTAFFIAPEVFQQMFPKLETHPKKESSTTNTADHNKNNESTKMTMIDLRKADIFSLGVVMRMLLFPVEVLASGNVPEGVLNNPQFCNGSEEEDPKSSFSSLIHPSITRDCKKLITNLLLSNPNDRFTCDQILNSDFIKKIFSSTENSSCYHLSPSMANLVLLRNQIIFDDGTTDCFEENEEISNQQQQISSVSSEATKFYQQLLQKEEVEIQEQERKIQKLQEQKAILPIIVPSPSLQQQQQAHHHHPPLATTTTTTSTKSNQQPKIIITPRTSSPKQNDNNSDSAGDFGVPLLNFVNAATAKKRTSTTSTPRNETISGTQQPQQDQQEEQENNVVVTFRSASVDSKNQQHHHVVPSSSSVSSRKN